MGYLGQVGRLIPRVGFDNIHGRLETSPGRFLPKMLILSRAALPVISNERRRGLDVPADSGHEKGEQCG